MKPLRSVSLALALVAPGALAQTAGFGAVSLGMSRATAITAAGPEALVGPLCGGAEGVLFPTPQGDAMAMFDQGQVSEMALTPPGDGAERPMEACAATARSLLRAPGAFTTQENAGIVETLGTLATPRGELRAISRWSSRTGACYLTLHWLAPGATSRIVN
ncbi:hypothetical protein ACQW02_23250 [Humitalea sp. 24SJ18S-53]|uniref:hypothetical protein n=1 Tax=Humitalea sp. 24SJ18S-53 TaxID=3422307 RepID=UPI003D67D005